MAAFNRFGDSVDHIRATLAAGGRWVQVIYTSGRGTPQHRDILALAGETPEAAGRGLLSMPGFENERILAAGEQNDNLDAIRRAALLIAAQEG